MVASHDTRRTNGVAQERLSPRTLAGRKIRVGLPDRTAPGRGRGLPPVARKEPGRRSTATPDVADLDAELSSIAGKDVEALRGLWRKRHGAEPPEALTKDLIARALTHSLQEQELGGLRPSLVRLLASFARPGSVIVREHAGVVHEVMVTPEGFLWRGETWSSLSTIALKITGTSWNCPRFFGLRGDIVAASARQTGRECDARPVAKPPLRGPEHAP